MPLQCVLKDTLQRNKSLTGFSICLIGSICWGATRYALRCKRDLFHIEFLRSRNISKFAKRQIISSLPVGKHIDNNTSWIKKPTDFIYQPVFAYKCALTHHILWRLSRSSSPCFTICKKIKSNAFRHCFLFLVDQQGLLRHCRAFRLAYARYPRAHQSFPERLVFCFAKPPLFESLPFDYLKNKGL